MVLCWGTHLSRLVPLGRRRLRRRCRRRCRRLLLLAALALLAPPVPLRRRRVLRPLLLARHLFKDPALIRRPRRPLPLRHRLGTGVRSSDSSHSLPPAKQGHCSPRAGPEAAPLGRLLSADLASSCLLLPPLASSRPPLSCLSAACLLPLCCMSAASRLPLGCMSAASRLPLGCMSAASRLPLCCMSAASRLPPCCMPAHRSRGPSSGRSGPTS